MLPSLISIVTYMLRNVSQSGNRSAEVFVHLSLEIVAAQERVILATLFAKLDLFETCASASVKRGFWLNISQKNLRFFRKNGFFAPRITIGGDRSLLAPAASA